MLLKLQTDFISRAKKSLVNFGKDSITRKSTRVYYTTKLTAFGKIVSEFESNHRELITLIPTSEKSSYSYFKDDYATMFEDMQIDYITAVQGEHDTKFQNERAPQGNTNGTHLWSGTSLPTVTIPHFSGAHTEWKAFHDLFRSIVHSNEKCLAVTNFNICSVHCLERREI